MKEDEEEENRKLLNPMLCVNELKIFIEKIQIYPVDLDEIRER